MYTDFRENNIYYDIFGNGKTTLLLLHGWGCSSKIFLPIVNALKNKYRIIAVDFNGHGQSQECSKTFYVKDFAEIVYKLLIKLNVDSVGIIAHSFGARVAIYLASHHQNLISKLIITGGAGIILKNKKKLNVKTIIYKLQKKTLNLFRNIKCLSNRIIVLQEKLIQKYGSEDYKALSPNMRKTFVAVISEDLTSYLKDIIAPTLLIWGDNDTETPLTYSKIMNDNISDSAVIIFENMGHFAFLEDSNRFIAIADNFFSED